jgi:hypothetical protein
MVVNHVSRSVTIFYGTGHWCQCYETSLSSSLTVHLWPVLLKFYNCNFMIVNYASVWSITYNCN